MDILLSLEHVIIEKFNFQNINIYEFLHWMKPDESGLYSFQTFLVTILFFGGSCQFRVALG